MKIDESGDEVRRNLRLFSVKQVSHGPRWIKFIVNRDYSLEFVQKSSNHPEQVICKLCDKAITGRAAIEEGGSFFHPDCLHTYRKLGDMYGSHAPYALQPSVVNMDFFFVDIVGLSNPHLSVETQIGKIERLNSLILECNVYVNVPSDKKIVLPTGDGMAIGFLSNPELPLLLGIELHRRLRELNAKLGEDKAVQVRIGLGSGPVFVVTDVKNNQNVWGPGIILARRVMDLGDEGHILLADNIAETLIGLKDTYRNSIKLIDEGYKIKHGVELKLYSAYSEEFGNPKIPSKVEEKTISKT